MYIIANFKQNKTFAEYELWINEFIQATNWDALNDDIQIILAPSFPFIVTLASAFKDLQASSSKLRIYLASQNVSKFENGAHTGEVGATQLKDFIDYAIIGHSERRADGETMTDVNMKVGLCVSNDITPVVCVSREDEFNAIDDSEKSNVLIAYEPIDAISTSGAGKPASVSAVKEFVETLGLNKIIYGGSINSSNVRDYLNQGFVDGFLVGSASLDPVEFTKIIGTINQAYV